MGGTACVSSSGEATYSGCTHSNDSIMNVGSIVGIVIGSLIGIAVIIALIILIYKLAKRNSLPPYPAYPPNGYNPSMNMHYQQEPMGRFEAPTPTKPSPYSETPKNTPFYENP